MISPCCTSCSSNPQSSRLQGLTRIQEGSSGPQSSVSFRPAVRFSLPGSTPAPVHRRSLPGSPASSSCADPESSAPSGSTAGDDGSQPCSPMAGSGPLAGVRGGGGRHSELFRRASMKDAGSRMEGLRASNLRQGSMVSNKEVMMTSSDCDTQVVDTRYGNIEAVASSMVPLMHLPMHLLSACPDPSFNCPGDARTFLKVNVFWYLWSTLWRRYPAWWTQQQQLPRP